VQAFGVIGLVIGPLVFSLLMSIIDIYKQATRSSPRAVATFVQQLKVSRLLLPFICFVHSPPITHVPRSAAHEL
jgi:predicted PurR-regulated permease PerM